MALPDVISALVTLAQANVPAGVLVFDGIPPTDPATGETVLAIGTAIEPGTSSDQDFGRLAQWDTYDIVGWVRATSGDISYAQDRNAAWVAWTAFRLAVQRDPKLGGLFVTGGWIRPSDADYTQTTEADVEQGASGVYAQVDWKLTVTDLVRP